MSYCSIKVSLLIKLDLHLTQGMQSQYSKHSLACLGPNADGKLLRSPKTPFQLKLGRWKKASCPEILGNNEVSTNASLLINCAPHSCMYLFLKQD